jgi:ribose transport system substrate-binding protein
MHKRSVVVVAVVGFALVASGSSSSSKNGGSQASGSVAPTGSSSTSASPTNDLAIRVAALQQRPGKILDRSALPGAAPSGKKIVYVRCGVASCVALAAQLKQAADILGWTLTTINAGDGSDPAQIQNAYTQAIALHPDAVIGSGFSSSVFSPQLRQLQDAKIPVIELYTGDKTDPDHGVYQIEGTPFSIAQGAEIADYTVTTAGKSANTHTLIVSVPAFPTLAGYGTGFDKEYKSICPQCQLATVNIPVSGLANAAPPIVSYLQSHADINTLVVDLSDIVPGLPAALKAANLSNRIKTTVTVKPGPVVLSYIRNGEWSAAASADSSTAMFFTADVLVRLFMKVDPAYTSLDTSESWIITKSSLPSDADISNEVPTVADYAKQWAALWGRS